MALTRWFDEAFFYAHLLHRTHTRKGTPVPYISHLMAVSFQRIAGQPLLERDADEVGAQAHGLGTEDARVHLGRIARDQRSELHAGEDVALDVDARRDLDELEPLGPQREDTALGSRRARSVRAAPRRRAAEGQVLDVAHE